MLAEYSHYFNAKTKKELDKINYHVVMEANNNTLKIYTENINFPIVVLYPSKSVIFLSDPIDKEIVIKNKNNIFKESLNLMKKLGIKYFNKRIEI